MLHPELISCSHRCWVCEFEDGRRPSALLCTCRAAALRSTRSGVFLLHIAPRCNGSSVIFLQLEAAAATAAGGAWKLSADCDRRTASGREFHKRGVEQQGILKDMRTAAILQARRRLSRLSLLCRWFCIFCIFCGVDAFRLPAAEVALKEAGVHLCRDEFSRSVRGSLGVASVRPFFSGGTPLRGFPTRRPLRAMPPEVSAAELESVWKVLRGNLKDVPLIPRLQTVGRKPLQGEAEDSGLRVSIPSLLQCTYSRTLVGLFGRIAEHAAGHSWGIAASVEFDMKAERSENGPCQNARPFVSPKDKPSRAPWQRLLLLKAALLHFQNSQKDASSKSAPHTAGEAAEGDAELKFSEIPPTLLREAVAAVRAPLPDESLAERLFALTTEDSKESFPQKPQLCRSAHEREIQARKAARRVAQRRHSLVENASLSFKEFLLLAPALPFRLPFEVFEVHSSQGERTAFAASAPAAAWQLAASVAATAAREEALSVADATCDALTSLLKSEKSSASELSRGLSEKLGKGGAASALSAACVEMLSLQKDDESPAREAVWAEGEESLRVPRPDASQIPELREARTAAAQSTAPPVPLPLVEVTSFARIRSRLFKSEALCAAADQEERELSTAKHLLFPSDAPEGLCEESLPMENCAVRQGGGGLGNPEEQQRADWRSDWLETLNGHFEEELRLDLLPLWRRTLRREGREKNDVSSEEEGKFLSPNAAAAAAAALDFFTWLAAPEALHSARPPLSPESVLAKPFRLTFASLRRAVLRETEGEVDQTLFYQESLRALRLARRWL